MTQIVAAIISGVFSIIALWYKKENQSNPQNKHFENAASFVGGCGCLISLFFITILIIGTCNKTNNPKSKTAPTTIKW
jgi:hypothetical protein